MRIELDESFRPPRWLRNRHIQSILPSLSVRRRWLGPRLEPLLAASRPLLIDCGEGVRLAAHHTAPPRPLRASPRVALLLHGWEGSAESVYVLSLARELHARGFDVVRLNLRDHGDTQHLNRGLFHSCRLAEVIGAARRVQSLFPGAPLHLAGFSLGGNFMLRVAAARESGLRIARAVAISPVLDPRATLLAMERGLHAYQRYFVRKWTRSLRRKQVLWPEEYDFGEIMASASVRQMTAELVRRFTPFTSLEEYLDGYALVGARLAPLEVPCTVITALDDPLIPARDIERLAPSPALRIVATRWGGHCGFLDRPSGVTWAERRAAQELDAPLTAPQRETLLAK